MRARLRRLITICAFFFATALGARGDSWFRGNPDLVKRYSHELADKTRPAEERLEGARALQILLTVYGSYNFGPALRILETVRREPSDVGTAADTLLNDLRSASKRRNNRLPNPPVVLGPFDPAKIGIVR